VANIKIRNKKAANPAAEKHKLQKNYFLVKFNIVDKLRKPPRSCGAVFMLE